MKKKLIIVLVAVLVLGGGYFGYSSYSKQQAKKAAEELAADQARQEETQEKIDEKAENIEEYKEEKEEEGLEVAIQDSYEKWLAATMVVGMSIYYIDEDVEIEHIYLDDTTELEDHDESRGAYIVYKYNGEELILHSEPLEDKRGTKGSVDLSSENIGYATFDQVDSVDPTNMKEVAQDDLTDLINQCLLVTITEN